MTRGKPKIGICAYCTEEKPLTKDHIPPRNLFPVSYRKNIISVPCCFDCHKPTSQDDEYFRSRLAIRNDTATHPAAQEVLPRIIRSFQKPQKRGWTKKFFQSIQEFEAVTPAGIYLGKGATYDVDLTRLNRVAARVIKGLFYHHKHFALPKTYTVSAFSESSLTGPPDKVKLWLEMFASLASEPSIEIGKGIFAYWFRFFSVDDISSAWLLLFYNKAFFIGSIISKKELEKRRKV